MTISKADQAHITHCINLAKMKHRTNLFIAMMNILVFTMLVITARDKFHVYLTVVFLLLLFSFSFYRIFKNFLLDFPHRHHAAVVRAKEKDCENFCRQTFHRLNWSKTMVSTGNERYTIFAFRKEADAAAFKLFCL